MVHAFSVVGISVWGNIEMLCRPAKQCEFLLVCLVLFTAVAWAQPQLSYQRVSYTIDTFAGLPVVGDGRPAVQAQLDSPTDVAVDGSGNLYIADKGHQSHSQGRFQGDDHHGCRAQGGGWRRRRRRAGSPRRRSPFPTAWRWTARATSTSPIPDNDRIRKVDSSRDDHHGCRDGGKRKRQGLQRGRRPGG